MKEVLDALNTYANLAEIQEKAEDIRQHEETRLKEIKEQRAHFQAALDMCDALLYRFDYSVPDIHELHEIATKYGEPIHK